MRGHNIINGIATKLLDAGLQWQIAAVAISGDRHGEVQKVRVITKMNQ